MEQLKGRRNVENASDNVPESITKHKLFEKYLFFDQSDVNTYFYKKRTLSDLEFLSYKRNLDNMAKQINPALAKIDKEFKDKMVRSLNDDFSKSYSKKNRCRDIEPQSREPFAPEVEYGESPVEPQGLTNPFASFLSFDPIGLKKLSEHLPDVLETIGEKLPDTNERKQFLNAFKSFEDKVPLMSGFGSEMLQSTSDILNGLGELSPTILVTIAASWYAHARTWPSFAFFIACAIYFIIKVPEQLVYLFKLYIGLYDKIPECPSFDMDEIVPQFSDSNLELIGSVIATALIGAVGMNSKVSTSSLVLTFAKDFSRAKLGMIEVAKLIIKFIESIVNFFRGNFLNLPSMKFIDSCSKEIDMFSDEVRMLSFKYNRGTLDSTESTYSHVSCILEVGKHMLKTIPKDKFSEASLRLIHEDCNSLRKILLDLERSDVTLKGMRQEPVPVLLAGGPGTAKSVAAIYLSYSVAPSVMSPLEKEEFDINPGVYIYSRKQESVFFDGLTNKAKVIFYDDLLQARDAAGSPACEAMEIIRIINSEEYNAHMAHLENKGNVYLRPKFVVATTNQQNLTSNAIISELALKRRFKNMSFVVVPKREYTRTEDLDKDLWHRNIDYSKLPTSTIKGLDFPELKGLETTDLRPEHLEYHRYDLVTGKYSDVLYFDELVREVKALEFVKRKQFALHKENFRKLVQKYSAIYDTEVQEMELPDDYSYNPDEDTDSDNDDSTFIDSLLATSSQRREVENLLCADTSYAQKLFDLVSVDRFFSHSDDIIDVLLDNIGYHQLVVDILRRKEYQRDQFIPVVKKKLHIRLKESVLKYVNMFLDLIPSWKTVKSFLVGNAATLVSLLTFLVNCGLFTVFVKWIYNWWTGKPAPQSFGYSQKMRAQKSNKFVRDPKAMQAYIANIQPQFGEDTSGLALIESIVRRNCFKFQTLTDLGNWNTNGSVTFLTGRIAIMNYHFLENIFNGIQRDPSRLNRPIRLSHGNDKNDPGLLFTIKDIMEGCKAGVLMRKDMILVEFPKHMPERKNIIKHFCRRKQIPLNQVNLEIVLANVTNTQGFYFGRGSAFGDPIGFTEEHVGVPYTVEELYSYELPTKPGDCGSLMGILNSSQYEKIFGIHVAGHTHYGSGFSAVVTQEEILEDLELFEPQIVSEEPNLLVPQSSDFERPVRFEILGRTELVKSRNLETSIIPTRLYNCLGPNGLSPAALAPFMQEGTLIDPLLNAQMKYCKPDILFDHILVRKCCKDYFDFCDWAEVYNVNRDIYTTYEAIYGLEYDVDFGSIKSSSSSGWPWSCVGVKDIKKELFKYDQDTPEWEVAYEDIYKRVNIIIEKAKNNIRMFHVSVDNLKEELREDVKVLSGSTRLFSGCEITYLIAFRQYFGAFALWYMKNRISNGSAIGVNAYSSEWNTIAMRLIAKNINNILAGDFEKYDGSQKPVIHLMILDEINRWYDDGPENARVRSIFWMEVYNSKHIIDGVIYEWFSGLPSGHPFTIIINTIYNHIIARYNWCRSLYDNRNISTSNALVLYRENVYAIAQGDDIGASVTEEYKDLFNDVVCSKYSLELGMVYTNEVKSGEQVALRHLSEIEFLKRRFDFDSRENLYIAPLRITSIRRMVDWTTTQNKESIVADNVITAIKEFSLHPKEVYDQYVPKLIKEFKLRYPFLNTKEPIQKDFEDRRAQVLGTIAFF